MYERMLDKNKPPTENEIKEYIGKEANNNLTIFQSTLKERFDFNFEFASKVVPLPPATK